MKRVAALIAILSVVSFPGMAQKRPTSFPVKQTENPDYWRSAGKNAVSAAKDRSFKRRKAKNVILFVGDGMGVSTLTAARILEGQLRGESGEENLLSFERFPFSALSRTYSANQQTSDSAPTMSAIITGMKTNEGLISVNNNGVFGDYSTLAGNEAETLIEMAESKGRSTGVISTARLTHATPAACYSHSIDRNWESDAYIAARAPEAHKAGAKDIARQLIEFDKGNGLEVAMGGGRSFFLPKDTSDPEYKDKNGVRLDGRDLTSEWVKKHKNSSYVWDKAGFDSIDVSKTDHLLGLFERSHMQYEADRKNDGAGEPSLTEMTTKSIDLLSKNKKGYVLVVEAGRIDHAHHDGNAYRALTDTIELSNAVRAARSKVDLKDTLIIVTADHSHTFTIAGYPARGNNILGLVREVAPGGKSEKDAALDKNKMPYTTLRYADGPGARGGERKALSDDEVTDPDFKQEATIPLSSETHGGEDVAIFADGAGSYLFSGSMEENWIFWYMRDALRF
ncbi:MAG: alkaline phosphatase [Pyrinomonadaceae bacterium]